jgi:hypothetical protein
MVRAVAAYGLLAVFPRTPACWSAFVTFRRAGIHQSESLRARRSERLALGSPLSFSGVAIFDTGNKGPSILRGNQAPPGRDPRDESSRTGSGRYRATRRWYAPHHHGSKDPGADGPRSPATREPNSLPQRKITGKPCLQARKSPDQHYQSHVKPITCGPIPLRHRAAELKRPGRGIYS